MFSLSVYIKAGFGLLAWKIPWKEETGRLWSMGLQRVGHDGVTERAHVHARTHTHTHTYTHTHTGKSLLITP